MPITINGTTDARVGYVAPTIDAFSLDADGTHVAPGNNAGFIVPAVGSFSVDFDGQFGASASFDGDLNLTLDGFDVSVLSGQEPPGFGDGIQFVENATQDYDYGELTTLPTGFGAADFTFKIAVRAASIDQIGDTENSPGIRENWADETAEPYASPDWWWLGNFLLDGHNNSAFQDGTFSLQVYNSGYVRWTFGDGAAALARNGDVHGLQNSSGTNILDGNDHVIHCVRDGTALRLYVDGNLEDTETTPSVVNMWTNYWQNWSGYPANQDGWFFGAEKQAAIGTLPDYADFKGLVKEIAFYGDALSAVEIGSDQGAVDSGHVDYLDHFEFPEGSGTTTDSENGLTMNLVNPGDFWTATAGFWDMPSLQDETDFYTDIMRWTVPANADSFTDLGTGGYTWFASSSYGFGNIHGDTEGDNLWAWWQHRQRYGDVSVGSGSTTQDWVDDLTTYFNNNLLSELDTDDGDSAPSGYGFDHMYGQGLAAVYNSVGGASTLTTLNGLRTRIEGRTQYQTVDGGGTMAVAYFLNRGVARWAIVSAYGAEAVGTQAWIDLRDNMITAYTTATDWEDGGNIQNGGGAYFASSEQAGYDSITGYAGGRRYFWIPGLALAAEAHWKMYLQTGNATLRDRLIKMARYVEYYAHDPSWIGPNCGGRFGHEGDGSRYHQAGGASGAEVDASDDCSYDMAAVNILMFGYELTGDTQLLVRARRHFERGNRWDPGVPGTLWAADINTCHKYLDTQCDNTQSEFQFNKGALQYAYRIFENGGSPAPAATAGPIATLVDSMSSNTWAQLTTTTGLGTIASNYRSGTYGTNQTGSRGFFEYACTAQWVPRYGEIHFRGGGHQSVGIHIKYNESTGAWTYLDSFPVWEHSYSHLAYDRRNNTLFFRTPSSSQCLTWDYSSGVGSWGTAANLIGTTSIEAEALEYFPDANDGEGGLIHFGSYDQSGTQGGGVRLSNTDVSSWAWLNGGNAPFGASGARYHLAATYCPVQKVVLVGGGDAGNVCAMVEADGTVTNRNNLPSKWGPGDNNDTGMVLADEVTGRVFFLSISTNTLYEHNYDADTWASLGPTPTFNQRAFATMISTHGCIHVVAGASDGASTEYLYRL